MKKLFYLFACIIGLLLTSCNKYDWDENYYLHNATADTLLIVANTSYLHDTLALAPGEYQLFDRVLSTQGLDVGYLPLSPNAPLYIIQNGYTYMVDRNDMKGCLWRYNYDIDWDFEQSIVLQKNIEYCVFHLTDDYISRQVRCNIDWLTQP